MAMLPRLSLALIPCALIAQAPAPSPQENLRLNQPVIDKMLQDLQFVEAFEKAKSILPATIDPFEVDKIASSYNSYLRFWALGRTYLLASTAAQAAGQWETALEYAKKARDLSKENGEKTKEQLSKAIEAYQNDIKLKRGQIDGNADYIKWIQSREKPSDEEKQQLQAVKDMEESIKVNEKWIGNFQKAIEHAEGEAKAIAPRVEPLEKMIADQNDQLDKYKFKNDKVKFVEGIVASKAYIDQVKAMPKADQLSFFLRMAILDPSNKRIQKEIEILTGKVSAPEPVAKGKGKKK